MKKEIINKKTLEYLAELARIELKPEKEEKLLKDLEKILEHFEELEKVDVENIEPMAGGHAERDISHAKRGTSHAQRGGANLKNVFRQDESDAKCQASDVKLKDAFPEKEGGYLKVPEVF